APDDAVGRVAVTAANTAADLLDRWWQSQADHGRGLRGGAWTSQGYPRVVLTLDAVRLVRDLPVSGTVTWDARRQQLTCDVHVFGVEGVRRVTSFWDTQVSGAMATVTVTGTRPGTFQFLAP
ncbi:MAG: hypothetical protein ACR2KE_09270, partial [Candidatus Nanopelagicales bacterium]